MSGDRGGEQWRWLSSAGTSAVATEEDDDMKVSAQQLEKLEERSIRKSKVPVCKEVKVSHPKFTVKLADDYLAYPRHRKERGINEKRVQELMNILKDSYSERLCVVRIAKWPDKTLSMLDGQHLCAARRRLGDEVDIKVRKEIWKMESEEQYVRTYLLFNNQSKGFSRSNVIGQVLAGLFDDKARVKAVPKAALDGLCFLKHPTEPSRMHPTDAAALMSGPWYDAVVEAIPFLDRVCGDTCSRFLRKQAIYAALLATCRPFPRIARLFWTKLLWNQWNGKMGDQLLGLWRHLTRTIDPRVRDGKTPKHREYRIKLFNTMIREFSAFHHDKVIKQHGARISCTELLDPE